MCTCRELYEMLCDYLEGRLLPEVCKDIDYHLTKCSPCLIYIRTYKKSVDLVGNAKEIEMPEELKTILMEAFHRGKNR